MNISQDALGAARLALYCHYYDGIITNADIRHALEAAAPYLMVEVWDDGYLAGLADMQNGLERPNPYRIHP